MFYAMFRFNYRTIASAAAAVTIIITYIINTTTNTATTTTNINTAAAINTITTTATIDTTVTTTSTIISTTYVAIHAPVACRYVSIACATHSCTRRHNRIRLPVLSARESDARRQGNRARYACDDERE